MLYPNGIIGDVLKKYQLEEIGEHAKIQILGLNFNWDTIVMTWLAMAILIVIAYLATRNLQNAKEAPKGWQNFLELLMTAWMEQIDGTLSAKGKRIAPLVFTLFLYILTANWLGMFPTLSSPTNDLNTTLGLALFVVLSVHCLGVKEKGIGYFAHFFKPVAPFVVLHIVEEVAKPITLSFRLFGNILAGEILIIVLLALIPAWMPIPGVAWLSFSVFVGVVQAFVFTMLSMSYMTAALNDDH